MKLWHLLPQEDSTLEEITWISIADSSLGLCPKTKNPFILFDSSNGLFLHSPLKLQKETAVWPHVYRKVATRNVSIQLSLPTRPTMTPPINTHPTPPHPHLAPPLHVPPHSTPTTGGSRGRARRTPPKGPDSFISTYKIFET